MGSQWSASHEESAGTEAVKGQPKAASALELPPRILVVEMRDSGMGAALSSLAGSGYRVDQVANGDAAVDLLEQFRFDLLLSEVEAAASDGGSLLEVAHERFPWLSIIVAGQEQSFEQALQAMRKGACDYLLLPLAAEQLIEATSRVLKHRGESGRGRFYGHNLEQMVNARTNQLMNALKDLESSYDTTLEALGDALDLKDQETEGHSKRVTAYTIALARAMGVRSDEMKIIARGAFLHDIGKIATPDDILRKPARLTLEEEKVMREHCARGYNILRKIHFLGRASEIVYCHQEHFDGRGYPNGLKGNEIPLGARIFAVADTLDAITSDRPYRRASSFNAARKEILRCSGTQFDPRVVETFLKIPNDLWMELRSELDGYSDPGLAGDPGVLGNGT